MIYSIDKSLIKALLPKRPENAHKGTFGSVLIIAGSKNYPGAAILSVLACARSGAGLVTLATTPEVYKIAVPKIPFATFLEFGKIEKNLDKYDAILIGPGLGMNKDSRLMIKEWIGLKEFNKKKIVIDADALNILSEIPDWYKNLERDAILTPHLGEMARLTKLSVEEIQNEREAIALKFSKLWSKTIILKGAETIIANPRGEIYKADFANPLLATAGTGDVLAGIITGLLAQGLNLTDAAIVGVYIHGLTGEKLKEKFGVSGSVATDLIETMPEVTRDLYSKAGELS